MDPFKPWQPKPRPKAPPLMTLETAEAVALRTVAFIVADDDLLAHFLSASGCGADDLKRRLGERGFLIGALDFLLSDETTVLEFSRCTDTAPGTPCLAREFLARAPLPGKSP